ncbi:MAG: hypothetical protein ITG00_01580 [Flavobacterium sp.]|nr:hypothetical protein [Flavobacterium sp.]
MAQGGFVSHNERIDAHKVRARSESFNDHFSQAKMFYESQTNVEQRHISKALQFEIGKVETMEIRVRMLGLLSQVSMDLASEVAKGLGMKVPAEPEFPMNKGVGADAELGTNEPTAVNNKTKTFNSLSMLNNPRYDPSVETRKVAIICSDGTSESSVMALKSALKKSGAMAQIVAPHLGFVTTDEGGQLPVDFTFFTCASVLFDGVFMAPGDLEQWQGDANVIDFISDAYRHCKPIGGDTRAKEFIESTHFAKLFAQEDDGILMTKNADDNYAEKFITALSKHRFWTRETKL